MANKAKIKKQAEAISEQERTQALLTPSRIKLKYEGATGVNEVLEGDLSGSKFEIKMYQLAKPVLDQILIDYIAWLETEIDNPT